ncbi:MULTISPECIES: hypothetical protein [unclassified Mucilaginibacter]|uniref:hypothetical protein n=1 Tax=unclassified Mucilaginibacter TaxID=2617802 RepID=UPI002AC925DC|nr:MULTISPECIES: hypothetical protein [unclassified Mucilaginibacter]MEB0263279.1 hypothetical protein [Mucilaginibacter sp. 10I4]MEB0278233.1 hypothetical protein [Mucilaginibacter sp. 10B2]MEB0300981.1 hypothetical protein [Mucilaginibacter sp. 5C4]WPX23878.1 hypothetical protein RHM67_01110 [Mucilaginibacter sp. 5C4]
MNNITPNFVDKTISIKRAITILDKNGIKVGDNGAVIILNFLCLIAKTSNKPERDRKYDSLKGKSNSKKIG